MRNATRGPVRTDDELPKFEGFEERLLGELKTMVAARQLAVDPVGVPRPGRSPFRMPVSRRVGLVGAIGLAGAVAAAIIVPGELVINASPAPRSAHYELTSFLNQAAAAARSQAVALPKPGQVFVERVKTGETGPRTDNKVRCYLMTYATPGTGQAAFPTRTGPCGARTLMPYRSEFPVESEAKGGFTAITLKPDHSAQGYPDPAKLPTSPPALLTALNRAARQGRWDTGVVSLADGQLFGAVEPRNATVFGLIERLLQMPIRPALRAALFEVTGRLPGIKLDRHATDLIGRPGVGISLPQPLNNNQDGLHLEFVLDSKTYQFLGLAMTDSIHASRADPAKYGYAVIKGWLVTPKH